MNEVPQQISIPIDWLPARSYLTTALQLHAGVINRKTNGWDDLRFPAQGINPAGTTSPASFDNTTYPGTLLFSQNVTNIVAGVAQMPHAWKEHSPIHPHIHWSKTTADGGGAAVAWEFMYALATIGGSIGTYSAWLSHTLAVGDLTTLERHNLSTFPSISMTGRTISTIILWQLQRDVTDDAYGADARLLELDFHYELDSNGSRQEYTK